MKRAMFIKTTNIGVSDALHYKLSDPIRFTMTFPEMIRLGRNKRECFNHLKTMRVQKQFETYDVVVSVVVSQLNNKPEAKVFPANSEGNIISFKHLASADSSDHEEPLIQEGYEIM
jgi:hypothetical protein